MVNGSQESASNLSPIRLVIITAISIFTAEALAMFLISIINPQSHIAETLIDSTMLVILVSPALYLFLFRPLITNMKERERMQKDLEVRESKLVALMESALNAIVAADGNGVITHWNAGATKMFGYTAEEIIGKPVQILMPEAYRQAHGKGMERFKATMEPKVIGKATTLEGLRKDNSVFPMEISLGYGTVREEIFFVGMIHDITQRVKMGKEVSHLADISRGNPDPIIEIDTETGLIKFCNDAARAFFGNEADPKPGNGPCECKTDWNHPLLEGLKPMIEELRKDGEEKSLDIMEAEVGKPNTETYRVYARKLRYVPKENLVRLHTADITREQELIKTTRRLLHEVKEIRRKLEDEHKEAEQVGKSLLAPNPQDGGIACVEVEPSSKSGGDRAGFITEKGKDGKQKEWLVVLDASGHGKGAAKFQEVALGGLMTTLALGRPMGEALKTANLTLERLATGRFLVGSIWRVMREKKTKDGWVYIEEFNIAQHPIITLDPEENEPKEWQWSREQGSGSSMPMGLFDDGLNNIKPKIRKVKRDTRILTYTDGVTEAMNADKEPFGVERLKDLVIQTRELSPELARIEIVRAAKCWTGGLPESAADDDIGCVVLEDDITIAIVDIAG